MKEKVKMAKHIENECAFCAEEMIEDKEVVGKDWKVYCSEQCSAAGEKMSIEEWQKAMESGEWRVKSGKWEVASGKPVYENTL
jgi:hypothetical protein